MRSALALLTASLLCLAGCGATSPAGPAPGANTLTGNWSLTATTSGPSVQIGAYLVNSSGALSGTMHIINNTACYPFASTGMPEDVPFTGTYNSTTGAVVVTSSSVSSQVITIHGTVASGTTALTSGTYSIAGGCADGASGTITGNEDNSLTNTYTGTLTSPSYTISAPITEQGPDEHGLFSIASTNGANFVFTGTPACFATGIPNGISYVSGTYIYFTMVNGDASTLTFTGAATSYTGTTITGTYVISGGACNGDTGTLTMSHP